MASLVEQRTEFVNAVNRLFSAGQIEETRNRLLPLLPAIDALEIVQRLGLLSWVPRGAFLRYREVVGIPPVHMQVLTAAFHGALLGTKPVPLVLNIVHGPVEAVSVTSPPGHIAVTLTRTGLDPLLTAE